jgi:hypothetical protein
MDGANFTKKCCLFLYLGVSKSTDRGKQTQQQVDGGAQKVPTGSAPAGPVARVSTTAHVDGRLAASTLNGESYSILPLVFCDHDLRVKYAANFLLTKCRVFISRLINLKPEGECASCNLQRKIS